MVVRAARPRGHAGTRRRPPRPSPRTAAAARATGRRCARAACVVGVRDDGVGRRPGGGRSPPSPPGSAPSEPCSSRWSGQNEVTTATLGLRAVKQRCELVSSMTVTPPPRRVRSSVVGQRFPARAVVLACTSSPRRAQEPDDERGGGRLPGRAGDADRRRRRPLEDEVGRASGRGSPPRGARPRRGHLGRPDVEERLVDRARAEPERRVRSRTVTPYAARARACRRRRLPAPASVTRRPSRARRPASATWSGSNPSTSVLMQCRSGRRRRPAPIGRWRILPSPVGAGQR